MRRRRRVVVACHNELARLICASNPSSRAFGFVMMCNTQSVRAGSRHDLTNIGNDVRAINLRV
jgi:hypothetical protein